MTSRAPNLLIPMLLIEAKRDIGVESLALKTHRHHERVMPIPGVLGAILPVTSRVIRGGISDVHSVFCLLKESSDIDRRQLSFAVGTLGSQYLRDEPQGSENCNRIFPARSGGPSRLEFVTATCHHFAAVAQQDPTAAQHMITGSITVVLEHVYAQPSDEGKLCFSSPFLTCLRSLHSSRLLFGARIEDDWPASENPHNASFHEWMNGARERSETALQRASFDGLPKSCMVGPQCRYRSFGRCTNSFAILNGVARLRGGSSDPLRIVIPRSVRILDARTMSRIWRHRERNQTTIIVFERGSELKRTEDSCFQYCALH
jgi:hypothetical protein